MGSLIEGDRFAQYSHTHAHMECRQAASLVEIFFFFLSEAGSDIDAIRRTVKNKHTRLTIHLPRTNLQSETVDGTTRRKYERILNDGWLRLQLTNLVGCSAVHMLTGSPR